MGCVVNLYQISCCTFCYPKLSGIKIAVTSGQRLSCVYGDDLPPVFCLCVRAVVMAALAGQRDLGAVY